jgi:hypothetical protein
MPQKAHKTLECLRLIDSIAKFGFDVMPYSFCKGKGFWCKMIERSSYCAECTRRGRSCDALGTAIAYCILVFPIFWCFYAYFF